MYRIRLASGEQAVYKTVEELAAAVASGVVSPTAEVFHKAANRWLPINTHPDYRAVVTDKRPALPEAPQETSLPERHTPITRKSGSAGELDKLELMEAQPASSPEPASFPEPEAPKPVRAETPPLPPEPKIAEVPDLVAVSEQEVQPQLVPLVNRPKSPVLLISLSAGGLVAALAIAAVLLSRGSRPGPETTEPPAPEQAAMEPAPSPPPTVSAVQPRTDTVPVVYPAPSKPLSRSSRVPTAVAQPAPAPPARVTSRLGTSVNRLPSYYEAYADARAEMDEALTYVDFRRVFAPSRFSSPDSIRAARRMVAAAVNILRVYRGREVMLEQTYRPGEPDGKGSLREPFTVAEASRGLLADVDSLFAILAAQESEVRLKEGVLHFQNPRAAESYSQLRREILQNLSYVGDPAEAADRVTMPRLLRAFGTDRPPAAAR